MTLSSHQPTLPGSSQRTRPDQDRTTQNHRENLKHASFSSEGLSSFVVLRHFLPECESCSRGPVWLQVLVSGAALESAGCSSSSREKRHRIRVRRDVSPPAACSEDAIASLILADGWKKVEAAGHMSLEEVERDQI